MRAKLITIGNSRGVRLPKLFIEEAGLKDEVEIEVTDAGILIVPARKPREGWAEAAQEMHARGDDILLDEAPPTNFDLQEWKW